MSTGTLAGCGKRFAGERKRLGFATPTAAAPSFGVTQAALSKIESDTSIPGGELLAHVAGLGMDIQFVLTGKRAAEIEMTTLGMCEAALRLAYEEARPGAEPPGVIALSALVKTYNAALPHIAPNSDVPEALRNAARQYVAFLDDPTDAALLERALFRPIKKPSAAGHHVSADRGGIATVAGRDVQVGGKGAHRRK